MSSWRKFFLSAMTLGLSGLMLFCIFADEEYYPFAPYTMYSYPFHSDMKSYHLYILSDAGAREISDSDVAPMDEARSKTSLDQSLSSRKPQSQIQSEVREKLKGMFERYAINRELHHLPNDGEGVTLTQEWSQSLQEMREGHGSGVEIMASFLP